LKNAEQIERMLEFCDVNQDEADDKHLRMYVLHGQRAVGKCSAAITEVEQLFDQWSEKTRRLFSALENACGQCQRMVLIGAELNSLEGGRRMNPRSSKQVLKG